jgi:hypothetical protein
MPYAFYARPILRRILAALPILSDIQIAIRRYGPDIIAVQLYNKGKHVIPNYKDRLQRELVFSINMPLMLDHGWGLRWPGENCNSPQFSILVEDTQGLTITRVKDCLKDSLQRYTRLPLFRSWHE